MESKETFTIKQAKASETEATRRLNTGEGHYKLAAYEYEHYDIVGKTTDTAYEIIEVKQRRSNNWDTWFIEQSKIKRMCEARKRAITHGYTLELKLCIVCDGVHQLYDVEDIFKTGVVTQRWMNKATAAGFTNQGEQVLKDIYDFPKDTQHIII